MSSTDAKLQKTVQQLEKRVAQLEKQIGTLGKWTADCHNKQERRLVALHNEQDRKFTESSNKIVKWAEATFERR